MEGSILYQHYAAHLAATGVVNLVMSDDSDTVMFGSPLTLFPRSSRVGKTAYKFAIVDLAALLRGFELTLPELQKICIALGSDFAEKTPRVGPTTAFTRGKNAPLTQDQKIALIEVASIPAGQIAIIPGALNLPQAALWLSDSKGFNYARVAKALGLPMLPGPQISLIMPDAAEP